MHSDSPFIICAGLVKIFKVAGLEVVALQGLDLDVRRGEFLALVGPSGSGKSTLLNALGGLDRPSAGRLEVDGQNILAFTPAQLTTYRREQVGIVWQQTTRNLLPYLSARGNIELLMTLAGRDRRARRAWATELLDAVGMTEHAARTPPQLSGGQQQRVAIACALANRPRLLLADEPTGEVDWTTAQRMLALLRDLRARYDLTVVIVTHDPRVAEQADRVVAIRDGRTSTETTRSAALQPTDNASAEQALPASHMAQGAEEFVVLDSAGRLQLPAEQRAIAGIGRRARVELVDGGLLVRPGDDGLTVTPDADAGALTPSHLYDAAPLPADESPPRRQGSWLSRFRRKRGG